MARDYTQRSVVRVCAMLNLLITPDGTSLDEIQAATGLPKSTAFRYMWTLENEGYVERDRRDRYQLAPALITARAVDVVAQANNKRVDEVTGERQRFSSTILPAWARKAPRITEVLPLLYLHGLSRIDFVPALGQFLGSTKGLSPAVITRLTEQWKADHSAFSARDLSEVDFVYLWADGIHMNIRLDGHRLCLLVLIGIRADGRKELVAITDGHRESAEAWMDLLRDCARRGMRAPVLGTGDDALGFWSALREVFPTTKEQRCWVHKTANVLATLHKSARPGAKKAVAEIWAAEGKDHARAAVKAFSDTYQAKFPKAVAKITDDLDELLAFYDYPAEHWVHLRTTHPIKSTLGTVQHRTKLTKRPGSRAAGIAMAFKLIESAQTRWRAVNAPHFVVLVRNGATFMNGRLELDDEEPGETNKPKSPKDLDPQIATPARANAVHALVPRFSAQLLPGLCVRCRSGRDTPIPRDQRAAPGWLAQQNPGQVS